MTRIHTIQSAASERNKRAIRTCILGILVNLFLFFVKIVAGLLSGSISVITDSVNSLSDSASGVLNLFGFHLSGKPADKNHPFGHGRIEYVITLLISCIIMVIGVEFFKNSVERIITPQVMTFSWPIVFLLFVSILVKILLFLYYRHKAKLTHSSSIRAAAFDSLSDSFITFVAMLSLLLLRFFQLEIDGYIGVLVSVGVIYAGFSVAKDAITPIIGSPSDINTIDSIREILMSDPNVLGVHDIIVHDYGPYRQLASAHIEFESEMSLLSAHQATDQLEKHVLSELNIPITLHIDPVVIGDSFTDSVYQFVQDEFKFRKLSLSTHDFRLQESGDDVHVEFDYEADSSSDMSEDELCTLLKKSLENRFSKTFHLSIHYDRHFFSACKD